MDPTIQAAIYGGAVQGLATVGAAIFALRAWRHNTLGTRQVQLAEECLTLLWELDKSIKEARMAFPSGFSGQSNREIGPAYYISRAPFYQDANIKFQNVRNNFRSFREKFILSEFYIGRMPLVSFKGESRWFKMDYSIVDEYDELIGQLGLYLDEGLPDFLKTRTATPAEADKIARSNNLYFGFMYEYEEDEYTKRLNNVKNVCARRIRSILRKRTFFGSFIDFAGDKITDYLDSRFKPTMTRKK
ncbi:hypothetical protein [Pseudoroseomonas ludipueritiae]|uniref:Uncharacterized protein n=1 Tax=Pseudoroseomonas ludipueritiae TaxID=198093 RepID=A0ABR7RAK6_9PROT|nr:hypothetical protein [Pseudoroseomonas ludipueritiae]MBC9178440.1 hypothetical protein [Pseudoroseomonas ludipueritiae]